MSTHYELLGAHASNTAEELSALRREKARLLHPDREGGDAEKMAAVNAAYAVLTDKAAVKLYRAALRSELPYVCMTCRGEGAIKMQRGFTKAPPQRCTTCKGNGLVANKALSLKRSK
jgi:curved DNA-binding protein CbpA